MSFWVQSLFWWLFLLKLQISAETSQFVRITHFLLSIIHFSGLIPFEEAEFPIWVLSFQFEVQECDFVIIGFRIIYPCFFLVFRLIVSLFVLLSFKIVKNQLLVVLFIPKVFIQNVYSMQSTHLFHESNFLIYLLLDQFRVLVNWILQLFLYVVLIVFSKILFWVQVPVGFHVLKSQMDWWVWKYL